MSTPTIELIRRHGSVRNYKPDPVPTALIETIVATAQCGSTSSNLQMMTVIAVTDADKRAQVAGWCGNQTHVAQAPLLLVWCADLNRLDRICALRGYSQVTEYVENFLVAATDAAIAAQTAALAESALNVLGRLRIDWNASPQSMAAQLHEAVSILGRSLEGDLARLKPGEPAPEGLATLAQLRQTLSSSPQTRPLADQIGQLQRGPAVAITEGYL